LAAGVAGATLRPWRLPAWLVPVLAAGIVVTAGGFPLSMAGHALRPLVGPVAFLLAAVPLAVLLDRLGFFARLADRLTRRGGGSGRLWVLAAVVTTTLDRCRPRCAGRRRGRRPVRSEGSLVARERSPWPARPQSAGWRPMSSTICRLC
jgi:hypothetical protein